MNSASARATKAMHDMVASGQIHAMVRTTALKDRSFRAGPWLEVVWDGRFRVLQCRHVAKGSDRAPFYHLPHQVCDCENSTWMGEPGNKWEVLVWGAGERQYGKKES
jgi:hypothetical protein